MNNLSLILNLLPKELFNTLYMVILSLFFATLIAFPLGSLLYLSSPGGLRENRWLYKGVGMVVNIGRSVPFAILIVAIIPFTRFVVGTSIGTSAAIVPLTLAAAPFMARLIEGAFAEISIELIEAAQTMGASLRKLLFSLLLQEALPGLVRALTLTMVNLVGYSAMAGLVGGGGLGKIAIQYGYQRFNGSLMVVTLILLVLLVALVQTIGDRWVRAILRKRGLL